MTGTGPFAERPLMASKRGKRPFTLLWQLSRMSWHGRTRHARLRRQRRLIGTETSLETANRYGFVAVASGLGITFGVNASDNAQKREAILASLPQGYAYSGCDEVRAAGGAPIYSFEIGFSNRLEGEGDGDGIGSYGG